MARTADAVVIGGGIIGASTLFHVLLAGSGAFLEIDAGDAHSR